MHIGTLATGCALGYLDLRFASLDWRGQYPTLAAWWATFGTRRSMTATWAVS